MAIWWKYKDVLNSLGLSGSAVEEFQTELVRCLATGRVTAFADFVIYNSGPHMIREEYVTIPASFWRTPRAMFSGAGRINFRPEINKLFNPSVPAPEGYRGEALDVWAADCFCLSYLGQDVMREFNIQNPKQVNALEQSTKASNRGRRPDKEKWRAFAAALAVVAAKGEKGGEALEQSGAGADVYDEVVRVIQARLGADVDHFDISHVQDTISLAQEWMTHGVPDTRQG